MVEQPDDARSVVELLHHLYSGLVILGVIAIDIKLFGFCLLLLGMVIY